MEIVFFFFFFLRLVKHLNYYRAPQSHLPIFLHHISFAKTYSIIFYNNKYYNKRMYELHKIKKILSMNYLSQLSPKRNDNANFAINANTDFANICAERHMFCISNARSHFFIRLKRNMYF